MNDMIAWMNEILSNARNGIEIGVRLQVQWRHSVSSNILSMYRIWLRSYFPALWQNQQLWLCQWRTQSTLSRHLYIKIWYHKLITELWAVTKVKNQSHKLPWDIWVQLWWELCELLLYEKNALHYDRTHTGEDPGCPNAFHLSKCETIECSVVLKCPST